MLNRLYFINKLGGGKTRHLFDNILFLGPALIFLFSILIYPLIYSLYVSFYDWKLVSTASPKFLGIMNYINALNDPLFWNALRIQFVFILIAIPLELIIGLMVALLFQVEFLGNKIIRTLLLIPFFILPSLSGLMWRFMLQPRYGLIGNIYYLLNMEPVDWLSSPKLTFLAVILQDIWRTWPFMFITLYAALSNFPQELKESAEIDGANKIQVFFKIILPLIIPAIIIACFLRLIDALRIFSEVYVMTEGGPGHATTFLSIYIYKNAFRFFNIGYANAIGYILTIISLLISFYALSKIYKEELS